MNLTREDLIARLKEDLARELGADQPVPDYAATASGPYWLQFVQIFGTEIADWQRHAE